MASLSQYTLLSIVISISLCLCHAQTSSRPKAIVLPVSKDPSTLQYITHLNFGSPSATKHLVVDLEGQHLWINCENDYISSSYKPAYCGSAACSVSKAHCSSLCLTPARPGCNNNTCHVFIRNTVIGGSYITEVATDTISLLSTDGSKTGSQVSISNSIFSCGFSISLDGLASGVQGMLGLGKDRVAFPTQLSSVFGGSLRRKFAICLPATTKSNGVMFFGETPYVFYPSYNTSKAIGVTPRFMYTKLHVNYERLEPSTIPGDELFEYFVKVTSILVNRKPIPINSTLLNFHRSGIGGSKISSVRPYTILESSIYKSLVKAFDKEISTWNATKVPPVAPFKNCYNRGNLAMSPLGLGVPAITFVFENKNVYWDMYGANSMVEINNNVACLGFLDGGLGTTTPIVIGGLQLQNSLVEFDLAASRMAFTSTLLLAAVECSNFRF